MAHSFAAPFPFSSANYVELVVPTGALAQCVSAELRHLKLFMTGSTL
jgi:hypothetical protein